MRLVHARCRILSIATECHGIELEAATAAIATTATALALARLLATHLLEALLLLGSDDDLASKSRSLRTSVARRDARRGALDLIDGDDDRENVKLALEQQLNELDALDTKQLDQSLLQISRRVRLAKDAEDVVGEFVGRDVDRHITRAAIEQQLTLACQPSRINLLTARDLIHPPVRVVV